MIPYDIIDIILLKLNDIHISTELNRDYVSKKICELNEYDIDWAAENSYLNIVKFLYRIGNKFTDSTESCACGSGNFELVMWLYDNELKYTSWSIRVASSYGYLDIVKFLHNIGVIYDDEYGMEHVIIDGNLETVKFLHSIGIHFENFAMNCAAEYGHLEIVKYLYSIGIKSTSSVMDGACSGGYYEIVGFLWSIGTPYDSDAMELACKNGHIKIVEFLYNDMAPFTDKALGAAIKNGHIEVIKFLYDKYSIHMYEKQKQTIID